MKTFVNSNSGVQSTQGFNTATLRYELIEFEGKIDFRKDFANLVSYDDLSKTVEIYDSLSRILNRCTQMGVSDRQYEFILLSFVQDFLPLEYGSVSLLAGQSTATAIFEQIALYVNSDERVWLK